MTNRRNIIGAGLAVSALMATGTAWAAYPDRPIRFVVPFAAGGAGDAMTRLVAQYLGEQLGQAVVVDNKAGGGTLIGAEFVKAAKPDGYTIFFGSSSTSMLMLRKEGSPIDFRKDFEMIMAFAESGYIILAGPAAPFKTLPDMIAYAKANPGKVTYSVPGLGSTSHVIAEYFSRVAGIKMLAVPYKGGGPASAALLAGEIMTSFDGMGPTTPLIKEGRVILLATTGAQRSHVFPNNPTVGETLPGFEAVGWAGVAVTLGTPKDVVESLYAAMTVVAARPEVRERLMAMSLKPISTTPAEYKRLIAAEIDKWGKVVRDANLVIQ